MAVPVPQGGEATREPTLRRPLATRLLAEQPIAFAVHLVAIAGIAAFLWSQAPHLTLVAWIAAVLFATSVHAVVWWMGKLHPTPEAVLPPLRIVVTVVGLAWGVGAAALMPALPREDLALLLLALGGLAAAGAATLAADGPAFRAFVVALLAPVPIGVLAHGRSVFHLAAIVLLALMAGFALLLHRRAHGAVTEQWRAAALLDRVRAAGRGERRFLDALFTSVPNAIAVVDGAGKFVGVNPGFEALYGFAADEVLGRPLVDLIVPEPLREAALELQGRVHAGATVVVETERCRKDGQCLTVQVSVTRAGSADEPLVVFLYTDLTRIRLAEGKVRSAEARLRQVLASSPAVIYATRIDGEQFVPTWVSENLTRITGHTIEEAMDPAWWYDHLHVADQARVASQMERLLTESYLLLEYRFRASDGTYHWVHDEARLIRDADGTPHEIFGTWLDVTDRKQAEDAMREARDLAEQSAKARATFLANMSHEIRTPMNAVLGLTELVLETELSPYQRRSLGLVRSAGETLLALLNDILDFSKIEAEHVALESIPFDLRLLVESTASLLAVRTTDRRVELAADVGPEIPHLVRGDPTRLRQVLSNLVGNAIKFTPEGEVVLSARAVGVVDSQVQVRFAVRDTGIGIPREQLDKIFQEFMQADASMTRKYGGTGLGLAIGKRLVGLMGGELAVTSEVGQGSEFSFTLTLPVEEAGQVRLPGEGDLAGCRLLVVDDNATNRRIVREILSMASVPVDEVPSTDAALIALRAAYDEGRPYALAIIDAQMPDKDGFELAVAVRSDPRLAGIRLLMLTSAGERGDAERCREVGIEGYLTKPASRSDLVEMAATLLAPERHAAPHLVTRHSIAELRQRLRILIAEDNPVNQEVAATMLRKRGHVVEVVDNGREAVEEVARRPYDVVLMDIQMPEMDGFAATEAIRARPETARLPIIALTAHALTGERERCIGKGMNGYIAKPFRPHDLFAAVEGLAEPEATPAQADDSATAFDPDTFRRNMREAGAEDAVDGILDMYVQHVPQRLAALTAAIEADDAHGIERAAHAFKSPSAAIGAVGLAGLLQEMELAGREKALDRARAAFEGVPRSIDVVLARLRADRTEPVR